METGEDLSDVLFAGNKCRFFCSAFHQIQMLERKSKRNELEYYTKSMIIIGDFPESQDPYVLRFNKIIPILI